MLFTLQIKLCKIFLLLNNNLKNSLLNNIIKLFVLNINKNKQSVFLNLKIHLRYLKC